MSKKKICFIAQFPPPIHGLSKAVDTLYRSELSNVYDFEQVDITNNNNFLSNVIKIWKSNADLFYFTISQTKGGNLRDLFIFKLLELKKKKCLIHLHGGYYRRLVDQDLSIWQRTANYKAISKLTGVIVLGNSLVSIFDGMIDKERVYTVPNCVDDEYVLDQLQFEKKMNELERRKVKHVLFLSNMIRTKGYPVLLELARKEKERCDSGQKNRYHFDFCGKFFSTEEENYYSEYVCNYDLDDYVSYHGVVTGEKKRRILRESDFFALPTRYPNEGQPISIIEAMANGLYIITTDHAGIQDLVSDGINGLVLTQNDVLDLKDLDDAAISHVAKNNRRVVQKNYTEAMYIKNMGNCFTEILDK